jgi:hypothetical protein
MFWYSGQTDEWTETLIWVGFPHCVPPGTLAARGLEELFSGCAVVSVFWLRWEMVFGFTSVLRIQYMMARRNRYFEVTDDGQKTPRGYPDFNSYVKNLHIFVFRMDGEINPVWASLTMFLQVHLLRVGWRNFSPLS